MSEEFIRTSDHGGFLVNEYKGSYSLNSAWESDDGTVRQNWALRQKGKDKYADKATPIKVELGDAEHAEAALLFALKQITGKEYGEYTPEDEERHNPPIQEDVPF